MVSRELACDMARPVTARSGALPGEEGGIEGGLNPLVPIRRGSSVNPEGPHTVGVKQTLSVWTVPEGLSRSASLTGGGSCTWRSSWAVGSDS